MKPLKNKGFAAVVALSALVIVVFGFTVQPVKAAEGAAVEDTDSAGILPTNPFYFIKKLGWNMRRLFTFDPVKKVDLELKIADQNVAEIRKLEDIKLDDSETIEKAIAAYEENLEKLEARLNLIKETSENPQIDEVLNALLKRGLRHQELFNRLKEKHEAIRGRLEVIQLRLNAVTDEIFKAKPVEASPEISFIIKKIKV